MKRLLVFLAACLFGGAALPSAASALAVRQVFWGFDGQVVPGTFNPLSVLVANPGAAAFDGQLELRPEAGLGPRGGGVFAAACYVAPGASRWVQFYPFFHNDYSPNVSGWTLVWGRGPGDHFDIDAPTLAAPARVWFAEPGGSGASYENARLKHFPDNLFPPTVSAADGLDTAVLDHVPRWEPARRAAFLDWVRRGGTLHLLPDATGQEPVFTDELALLNSPLDTLRVGNGRVIHHHGAPGDLLRENAFLAADPPAPALAKGKLVTVYDLDNNIFQGLNLTTRPKVRWNLLYALTALYLLAVGPGHYFWARRLRDYRLSLAVLTGGVVGFALLFGFLGRRGFNERSKVLTVATARALGGNRYDVMQWSNVFVTSGGVYTLTHPAEYGLYSSGATAESTAGLAASGRSGGFQVDLPLFSSCALLHRGVLTGEDTDVTPTVWKAEGRELKELRLSLPPGFAASRFQAGWARFQDKFYPLRWKDGALELSQDKVNADTLLSDQEGTQFATMNYYGNHQKLTAADVFQKCQRVMIANSLGGDEHFPHYVSRPATPATQAELFLFVNDAPESFHLGGIGNPSETSMIMYQRTVDRP